MSSLSHGQSPPQLAWVSPRADWQVPLLLQPQSLLQLVAFSPDSQVPSPSHGQSAAQLACVSPPSQASLPQ
jgi:hypothetical protein